MVKFSRELEAQLIPEWKEAFVNYRDLKKHVKKVKLASAPLPSVELRRFGFSLLDPIGTIARRFTPPSRDYPDQGDEENIYTLQSTKSRDEEVKEFYTMLEKEIEKVESFYKVRETEFCERADILSNQLQILLDLKKVISATRRHLHSPSVPGDEMIAALEKNGVTLLESHRGKPKKTGKMRTTSIRIDIPATNPTRTLSAVTSIIWEDLVNCTLKDNTPAAGDYISRKKMQCAEKIIRGAYIDLYKGLRFLNTYNSLNMMAFTKILKKFDKVSNQGASEKYMKVVKRSDTMSLDKVVRLGDEVESIFIEHFASNDRNKAMKFLRPHQPKDTHLITFFVGLFTGSFVTLFTVYAILAHTSAIFSTNAAYMETIYPVFSVFALVSLHIFVYGCNLSLWRSTRINQNFIFELSPHTALNHRDAFLICTSFMTAVVAALAVHLILTSTRVPPPHHAHAIPRILLFLFLGILLCPFNLFYRSTRYSFLRVLRNIVLSPLYRVSMADFFMADQLTSQIPLLRHMETAACYLMVGSWKAQPLETCRHSKDFQMLAYVISFLPYYWRTMQCVRRYMEEGHDSTHLGNAGKYISAMLAASARWKYALDPTPMWLSIAVITCTLTTTYQLYWDFVKDWGLLNLTSKNLLLRDNLILKNKCIYYISIALNTVLRLAWIETVLVLNMGPVEHRMVDFFLASLEIIRRGHWNFYRLENEHLNNVGKFRAVKTVPLPFREMDSNK